MMHTCQANLLLLLLLASTLATGTSAADDVMPDFDYMAGLIHSARRDGRMYPDFYRINPRLADDQLYAIQRRYVDRLLTDGAAIAGFKGGFVPRAPVGGVVLDSGLLSDGSVIMLTDFRRLVVEAEIAFRFCEEVSAPLADVAALRQVVCEMAPAIEVADAALSDFDRLKSDFTHLRQALIPLNIAYTRVLIGAPVAATIAVEELPVTMHHNDKLLGARSLTPAPDLWSKVLWVVNHFVLARGYTIHAGHYIIPGNLTGIHVGTVGRYRADFGALGHVQLNVDE